jgi:ankyrin repeat protein
LCLVQSLHWAVDWQQDKAVSLLLDAGASPNVVDSHGNTPLHKIDLSCDKSEPCKKIVLALIQHKADLELKNEFGRRATDHFDLTVIGLPARAPATAGGVTGASAAASDSKAKPAAASKRKAAPSTGTGN